MDQTHPDKLAVGAAQPNVQSDLQPAASRRSRLWRAVAGMAIALMIAASIVAVDLSQELVSRVSTYRSRIANLNRKMDRLKQKAAEDEKRLAAAREEIKERKLMESRDRIKAILLAPDRKTIKLASNQGAGPTATVTISAKMGGAVLSAHGLTAPPDGQVLDAWWMLKDAPPAKAAEFRSAPDGTANQYLDPPPQGAAALALSITREPSEGGIAPSGPVQLEAKVPAGFADERNGGVKKH